MSVIVARSGRSHRTGLLDGRLRSPAPASMRGLARGLFLYTVGLLASPFAILFACIGLRFSDNPFSSLLLLGVSRPVPGRLPLGAGHAVSPVRPGRPSSALGAVALDDLPLSPGLKAGADRVTSAGVLSRPAKSISRLNAHRPSLPSASRRSAYRLQHRAEYFLAHARHICRSRLCGFFPHLMQSPASSLRFTTALAAARLACLSLAWMRGLPGRFRGSAVIVPRQLAFSRTALNVVSKGPGESNHPAD